MPVVLLQASLSCASHQALFALSFLVTITPFSTQWISFKSKVKTAAEIAAPARSLHVSHHSPGAKGNTYEANSSVTITPVQLCFRNKQDKWSLLRKAS